MFEDYYIQASLFCPDIVLIFLCCCLFSTSDAEEDNDRDNEDHTTTRYYNWIKEEDKKILKLYKKYANEG